MKDVQQGSLTVQGERNEFFASTGSPKLGDLSALKAKTSENSEPMINQKKPSDLRKSSSGHAQQPRNPPSVQLQS